MATKVIQSLLIDGSFCEGGGQLLRNTVTLSALLSKPVSICNVRHNRKPPGLRKQHEAGIKLAAEICSADTTGVAVASTTVGFKPGTVHLPSTFSADPGTAASTTLLLQVSLPCLLFSSNTSEPSSLVLRGGTNATQAPQVDYIQHVFLPFMRKKMGLDVSLKINTRGYFPKGGGNVYCSISPMSGPLPAISLLERGAVTAIRGEARVGGLPLSLAKRMKEAGHQKLVSSGIPADIIQIDSVREKEGDAFGAGGGIVLWAETEGGCIIGGSAVSTKTKTPEEVGQGAAEELLLNLAHGGCVDEYLQDQIIIFLALAKGKSTIKTGPITMHTRTAVWVAEQMTGAKFALQENESDATIVCEGSGYSPQAS
ncbi:hypothetical protein SERLADRAFT_440921 [Serpula lacrymans var. lacrymans S7.9]|uniref:RNA 3'-terminal phosphate cyclase n=1 Tax=Serpula lacrymans var. lacrymans (strain S7.9) TaxID=578457 RepID=F8P4Z0_SERL9|nr:uncharacterized protein SERLADRAFT_440921 [Serpula lacrymans var. lacrymans S7.9]EGO21677.1 hypothetical protein SERLADRAFT_440921 [Serpula lacrymans var. lacrymans S7.9]